MSIINIIKVKPSVLSYINNLKNLPCKARVRQAHLYKDDSFEVILFESEKIGEGQFGACYLVYQTLDNVIILIKKVNRDLDKSSYRFSSEYKREVVNLSKTGSKY